MERRGEEWKQKKSRIPVLVRPKKIEQKQSQIGWKRLLEVKNSSYTPPTSASQSKVFKDAARSQETIERLKEDLTLSRYRELSLKRQVERLNDREQEQEAKLRKLQSAELKLNQVKEEWSKIRLALEELQSAELEFNKEKEDWCEFHLELEKRATESETQLKTVEAVVAERSLENTELRTLVDSLQEKVRGYKRDEVQQENNVSEMERRAVKAEMQLKSAELKFYNEKDEWSEVRLELERRAAKAEMLPKGVQGAVTEFENVQLRAVLHDLQGKVQEYERNKVKQENALSEMEKRAVKAETQLQSAELKFNKDEWSEVHLELERRATKSEMQLKAAEAALAESSLKNVELRTVVDGLREKVQAYERNGVKQENNLTEMLQSSLDGWETEKEKWTNRINELEQEKDNALVQASEKDKTIAQLEKELKELGTALEEARENDKEQRLKEEQLKEEVFRLTNECEKKTKKRGFFSKIFGRRR